MTRIKAKEAFVPPGGDGEEVSVTYNAEAIRELHDSWIPSAAEVAGATAGPFRPAFVKLSEAELKEREPPEHAQCRSGLSFEITMNIVGLDRRPTCDVCGVMVPDMRHYHDARRCVHIFTARCHGDVETTELTDTQVEYMGGLYALKPGRAFVNNRKLPAPTGGKE